MTEIVGMFAPSPYVAAVSPVTGASEIVPALITSPCPCVNAVPPAAVNAVVIAVLTYDCVATGCPANDNDPEEIVNTPEIVGFVRFVTLLRT